MRKRCKLCKEEVKCDEDQHGGYFFDHRCKTLAYHMGYVSPLYKTEKEAMDKLDSNIFEGIVE